jgi:hypothetical protein
MPSEEMGVLTMPAAVHAPLWKFVRGSIRTLTLGSNLGSGLIDQSQKRTAAAMQIAEK